MEYPRRQRSPLLEQILRQMQQTQQFQPQSYGALAAALGAQYLNQRSANKTIEAEEAKKRAQTQDMVKALGNYQTRSQGGPVNIRLDNPAGGSQMLQQNIMPDPEEARNRLVMTLLGNEHPASQAVAGQLMAQMLSQDAGDGFTLGPGETRFSPGGKQIATVTKPESEDTETWGPATEQQRRQYGIPNGYGAQISSRGKMATLGKDGQIININNMPPIPAGTQENIVGAFGMKRALNDMREVYDFASLPAEGAIRGPLSAYTGMDPKALKYQTAYDNFRTQQQAIIKGIPSNFDVRIFEKAAPSLGLAPKAKLARIEFQEKLTNDLIRMGIAFYKGTRSPIPKQIEDEAKALGIDVRSIAPDSKAKGYDEVLEMDNKKLVRLSDGSWMEIPEGVDVQ